VIRKFILVILLIMVVARSGWLVAEINFDRSNKNVL